MVGQGRRVVGIEPSAAERAKAQSLGEPPPDRKRIPVGQADKRPFH